MVFDAAGRPVIALSDLTDRDAVTKLSVACADYAVLVTGESPTQQDGTLFFHDCPPGRSLDSMLKLGARSSAGALCGLLDIVLDYPDPGIWYIGLLLIHPAERRAGLGRALVEGLARHATRQGARRLRLGVVEANHPALGFWTALGFAEHRRTSGHRIGRLDHTVIEFERELAPRFTDHGT